MPDDQRTCARFPAHGTALVKTVAGSEISVAVLDISAGGIGLLAKESIHRGVRVAIQLLDIPSPGCRVALGEGEVVFSGPGSEGQFRIGIRFTNADQAAVRQVIQCIQSLRLAGVRRTSRGRIQATKRPKASWY